MAKNIYTKGTTPVGEAFFAHLVSPETFQGKSTNKASVRPNQQGVGKIH